MISKKFHCDPLQTTNLEAGATVFPIPLAVSYPGEGEWELTKLTGTPPEKWTETTPPPPHHHPNYR